ncbi:MAG TPA: DUF2199 domain-containing protein [Steroidobacteraceae bacterium]|jgi:hypothetical protein|nr:DUF2199 domain-containing protein [Steroidobacteraceae bacterium]
MTTDLVKCAVCGKTHTLDNSELSFGLPDEIYTLAETERTARCDINSDICAIDRNRFFVRGLLPLRVKGQRKKYCIGVWSEISEDAFSRIYLRWRDPDQANEPRLSGSLSNRLPLHRKNSVGLAVAIQLTGPNTRPEFYLEPTDHPLYLEQAKGIDRHRAVEYSDRRRHDPKR